MSFNMQEVHKALNELKFQENGIKVAAWVNGRFCVKFIHGDVYVFDPGLTTVTIQGEFTKHGVEARLGDKAAINIKDVPDRMERSREAFRRTKELGDWYLSGTDQWNMPKGPREGGISEADLTECLDRCYPGKGQILLTASLKQHEGDLAKVREQWLATKQIAVAWVKLQAERREERAEKVGGDADALVAGILAQAE